METLTATGAATSTTSITKTKLAVTAAVMFLVGGAAAFAAIGSVPSLRNFIKVPAKNTPQKITTPPPTPIVKGAGQAPTTSCSSTLVVAKNPALTDKTRANPTGTVGDNNRAVASFTVNNCSNEDINLNGTIILGDTYRDNFPTTCASTYLKSMTLKDNKGVQMTNKITVFPSCAPGAVGRSSAYVLTLPAPYVIRKGQTIALTLLSDLKAALDPAAALLSFNGLRATGASTGQDYSQWLKTLPLQTVEITGFNSSTPAAPFLTQSCKVFSNCTINGFDVPSGAGIFTNVGEYFVNLQRLNAGETVDLSSITFHLEGNYIGTRVGDEQVSVQVHLNGALIGTATVTGVDNGTSNKVTLALSPNQHLTYNPANPKSIYFEVDSVENDFKALPGEKKSLRAVVDQFDWSDQTSGGPITATVPVITKDDLRVFTGQTPALNFTFIKDPNFTVRPIPPGASGTPFAQFIASSTESVDLRTVAISFITSNTSMLLGFDILVNGVAVFSGAPSYAGATFSDLHSLPLTTPITLAANRQNIITIKGHFSPQAPGGATISTVLDLTAVKRALVTLPVDPNVDPVTSDIATIQGTLPVGALRVTTLATPPAQSIPVGTSNIPLATFELAAGAVSSGENVRVTRLVINDKLGGQASFTNIANLTLYDQNNQPLATTASTATNGATTIFNLAIPLTVPKTGSITLTLKGDVLNGEGTHTFSIVYQTDVQATGSDTGDTILPTLGAGNGQPLTIVSSGSLKLSLVTGAGAGPSVNQNVIIGQTNVPVFAFKMEAQTEAIKLRSLRLTATGNIGSANDLTNIKLFRNNETTPFATAAQMQPLGTNGVYVFTWTSIDNLLASPIQPGTPVTVYVKADIGPSGSAILGDMFTFKITDISSVAATGVSSGTNAALVGLPIYPAGNLIIEPFSVVVTPESPTPNSSQTLSIRTGDQVGRFKITNNGAAKISLERFALTDAGNHTAPAPTYSLKFSDEGTQNFLANTAVAANTNGLDFATPSDMITISGGGGYRYLTVSIASLGGASPGDVWQLSTQPIDNVSYNVAESDLGYDANDSGTISGVTTHLYPDGGTVRVGTLVKQ